jgi:hypothetical protein
LVRFTGDLNPVPVNGKFSGSYSPGNIYISRFLLDRGPLSLSSSLYFGEEGLSVQDIQLFSGRSRLMRGEFFLPLSLAAVLAGEPWEKTVHRERDIYALFVRTTSTSARWSNCSARRQRSGAKRICVSTGVVLGKMR